MQMFEIEEKDPKVIEKLRELGFGQDLPMEIKMTRVMHALAKLLARE